MSGSCPSREFACVPTHRFPVTIRTILIGSSGDAVLSRACARAGLRLLAVISDAEAAPVVIASLKPDLVIIDTRALSDSLVLARQVARSTPMMLVGTHPEDAAKAFALNAIGFALEASDEAAFERVAVRLRPTVEAARSRADGRLVLKDGGRTIFFRTQRLAWIEAAGNYVRLHGEDGRQLIRTTLSAVEAKLDPNSFIRIHRSLIVNVEHVAAVVPDGRDLVVHLHDEQRLAVGRSYRQELTKRLASLS